MLSLVIAGGDKKSGSPFYGVKAYSDFLASKLGLEFDYHPFEQEPNYPVVKPYDTKRSAVVLVRGTKIMAGMVGEFRAEVAARLKLPQYCAGFELSIDELLSASKNARIYKPLSRFPRVEQDISLKVSQSINYGQVFMIVSDEIDAQKPKNSMFELVPLDIYQPEQQDEKHVALRLTISSQDRTLTAEEVNSLLDKVAQKAQSEIGAVRL